MVDEIVTRQELIDAQKDAQSLDDFINGGDEQIVVTRLLKEYPTLANAIRQIYEKGGKFYPTLAAANADIANIRADVYVITGDNGAYYKAAAGATTLTKSPYDPLEQAKADATAKANTAETNAKEFADDISTEKVKEVAVITNSKAFLHGYKDESGNIYAYYDNDANLVLAGLDESVQEEIIEVKTKTDKILIEAESTDLYHFTDEDKNLVAKIDENGKLYLTGLSQSVQDYLSGQQGLDYSSPKSFKTKALH